MKKYLAAIVTLAVLFLAGAAFANQDNPNGFRPFGKAQAVNYQVAASQTIKVGDAVTLNTSGYVIIATATSARILGVAASAVTSSSVGDGIAVYDDPSQVFIGQCSGTISRTDVDDTPLLCDIEGTTGIMEVDENAASYRVVQVFAIVPGETWGSANARVFFRFAMHLNSGNPAVAGVFAGAVTLDSLDVLGNTDATGGLDVDADSVALSLGAGADLSCTHDGTDTTCTTKTGDFYLDNTDVNDQTILRLGTDTAATAIEFRNNSDASVFDVDGAGQVDCAGNVDATGGLDVDADSVNITVGASADLAISHNGTDSFIDSVLAGADLIMKLGDDLGTSIFVVENNTGTNLLTVDGTGATAIAVTLDVTGNTDATGGLDVDADSVNLTVGAAGDLAIFHDGTDSFVDSVLAGADLIMKLGDDLATSVFIVENNTGTDLLTVNGTGASAFSGTLDITGNCDATGGLDVDADSVPVTVGAAADLTITHDGTDSIIDSALAGADLIMKLGDDLITSIFVVENNTGTNLFEVFASGAVAVTGDFSYTGHKLSQVIQVGGCYAYTQTVPGTDDWVKSPAGTIALPASLGPSVAICPISGLKDGDVIQAFNALGAVDSAGNNVNLTVDLRRTTKAAAATMTDASVSSYGMPVKTAPYALDDGNAAIAHTVVTDYIYYFRLTGTTTAATGIDFGGIKITLDRK